MHRFPAVALEAKRPDGGPAVTLTVLSGQVPRSLRGSLYLLAPCGNPVDGPPQNRSPSVPILNGDGVLHRVAFADGAATATARVLETPSQIADELAKAEPDRDAWGFHDTGITRISPSAFGAVNQANTALLPVRFGAGPVRLISCYDAGRPYEVCPDTLRVVAPVGPVSAWRANLLLRRPFPLIFTTAHPAFDAEAGEAFFVNYGRGFCDLTKKLITRIEPPLRRTRTPDPERVRRALVGRLVVDPAAGKRARAAQTSFVLKLLLDRPRRFSRLLRWRGDDTLEGWDLQVDGRPLIPMGSFHQVAVTRRFVVVIDTPYKFEMDLIQPTLRVNMREGRSIGEVLRKTRARRARQSDPQPERTRVYLVARDQLTAGRTAVSAILVLVGGEPGLPHPAVHLLADYDDEGGVVLHAALSPASDAGEFLHEDDLLYPSGEPVPDHVHGMFVGALRRGTCATWTVDPATGEAGELLADAPSSAWAIGLPAARNYPSTGVQSERHRVVWWYAHGLLPETISELAARLYLPSLDAAAKAELASSIEQGVPGAVLLHDTAAGTLREVLRLAEGELLISPQVVPGGEGAPDHLLAVRFRAAGAPSRDLVIYEVGAGPSLREVAVLDADPMGFSYTLHTAWIDAVVAARRRPDLAAAEFPESSVGGRWAAVVGRIREGVIGRLFR